MKRKAQCTFGSLVTSSFLHISAASFHCFLWNSIASGSSVACSSVEGMLGLQHRAELASRNTRAQRIHPGEWLGCSICIGGCCRRINSRSRRSCSTSTQIPTIPSRHCGVCSAVKVASPRCITSASGMRVRFVMHEGGCWNM